MATHEQKQQAWASAEAAVLRVRAKTTAAALDAILDLVDRCAPPTDRAIDRTVAHIANVRDTKTRAALTATLEVVRIHTANVAMPAEPVATVRNSTARASGKTGGAKKATKKKATKKAATAATTAKSRKAAGNRDTKKATNKNSAKGKR